MSYADVNGLSLYYEEHGAGEPLILLHGGLGGVDMFAPILPELAKQRRVIAVDLQGHNHTADIDRPLHMESSADDIAALIRFLGLEQVDVMGYSFGGGVALRTAVQHPDLVRRLIVLSFPFRRAGWLPDVLAQSEQIGPEAAEFMRGTPPWEMYMRNAPRTEDFPQLVGKVVGLSRVDFDYSADVAALPMPVLLVFGDADSVGLAHAVEYWNLLGGGLKDGGWDGSGRPGSHQLAILPDATHYTTYSSPVLLPIVDAFLG